MRSRRIRHRLQVTVVSLLLLYLLSISPLSQPFPSKDNTGGQDLGSSGSAYNEGLFMSMAKAVTPDIIKWMTENPMVYNASATPPIPATGYKSLTRIILKILVLPYQILVLLTGVYITYVSIIPRRRAHAKQYLTRLIVGMSLTAMSPVIFQVILDIEKSLLFALITASTQSTGGACSGLTAQGCLDKIGGTVSLVVCSLFVMPYTCGLGGVALLVVVFSYAVVWLRYAVVTALGVIFPATVFLYMWDYTSGVGKRLMKYTFIWIFMPLVQAFFMVILLESLHNWSTLQGGIMAVGSFIGVMLSPLIMTGLMKVAGGVTVLVGGKMQSPFLTGVGQLMRGYGPGALASAGATAAYRRGSLGDGGQSYGGVGMVKSRPSLGGGLADAARALGKGDVRGAVKSAIFSLPAGGKGGDSISQRHMAGITAGWRMLTGEGMSIGARLRGLGKVGLSATAQVAHAHLFHPLGTTLTGMFHSASDLAPAWIKTPLNAIGEALLSNQPVRGVLKGVGTSLGLYDAKKGFRPLRLALGVGLGFGMFTPVGTVALLGAMGATLGGGFVLGRGVSLKGVVEGYGAARGARRGVITSAFKAAWGGLNVKAAFKESKLEGLKKRRERFTRALREHIGVFEDRVKKVHSGAGIGYTTAGQFEVSRPPGITAAQNAQLQNIENDMNAQLSGNTRIGGRTLGGLINERNTLDTRIGLRERELAEMKNLTSTVEGMATVERSGLGVEGKSALDLEIEAQKNMRSIGSSLPTTTPGLTVAQVTAQAAAAGQTPEEFIEARINGLGVAHEQAERIEKAKKAYKDGDDIALQVTTGFLDSSTTSQTIYTTATAAIGALGLPAEEQERRRTVALEAIGLHFSAQGKRSAAAEGASLLNPKTLLTAELTEKRDLVRGELVRSGVIHPMTGAQLRDPADSREQLMLNAFNSMKHELTPGMSGKTPAEEREAALARDKAKYMNDYASYVEADLSQLDPRLDKSVISNRRSHAEYMGRIEEALSPVFQLDEQRRGDVETLLAQTIRGDESTEELQDRRGKIDQSLQDLGRAQYLGTLLLTRALQKERRELERRGNQFLQSVGINPNTTAIVTARVTAEAHRSELLSERILNTHQMLYDGRGIRYHVTDPGRRIYDPTGTVAGSTRDPYMAAQRMIAAGNEEYTVEAQELYDYYKRGEDVRRDVAKQEALRTVEVRQRTAEMQGRTDEVHRISPEIAVHMKEYDKPEYVPSAIANTGNYTLNPATNQYDYTPGIGTYDRVIKEAWVSTVQGLSDDAARRLYDSGVRTWEDFTALYPNHRRAAARNRRQITLATASAAARGGTPDPNTMARLANEAAEFDRIADKKGEAHLVGLNDEIEMIDANGTPTTMETAAGVNPETLDAAYEHLKPRTVGVREGIHRKPRDWRVDQAATDRKLAEMQKTQRNPARRKLLRQQRDIEGKY